jgi:hypothetical protein
MEVDDILLNEEINNADYASEQIKNKKEDYINL